MDPRQVAQVRLFNRRVTRHVGALNDSYLRRGRPLGEARVLFEIGPDGAAIATLRARLGLDPGYLSRVLRSLDRQGLLVTEMEGQDGRTRRVVLTGKGRAEYRAYDRLSDKLAASFLEPLDVAGRARLVAAMGEVDRLLRSAAVEVTAVAPDSDAARNCLGAYFRELGERFEDGFDARSNPLSDDGMRPPAGLLLLAWLDGVPSGCGALTFVGGRTGEIKRMWTAPAARGLGIARRLLRLLETTAREAGCSTIRLDTNRALTEAQAMYRREGYREVERFNDNPYAHHWFEKRL
ncbi:MAG: MarR family transcriptional regulator [Enterovirga sp.]|nr:MarR family transcriptional regulator [Enterovirga sp.]